MISQWQTIQPFTHKLFKRINKKIIERRNERRWMMQRMNANIYSWEEDSWFSIQEAILLHTPIIKDHQPKAKIRIRTIGHSLSSDYRTQTTNNMLWVLQFERVLYKIEGRGRTVNNLNQLVNKLFRGSFPY
jgi:hypothetical protein